MDYEIEDWLADLNLRIVRLSQTRDDLAQLIHLCEEALGSLDPVFNYVRSQRSEIVEMMSHYDGLYRARFKEAPPELPADRRRPVKTLSASSSRSQETRSLPRKSSTLSSLRGSTSALRTQERRFPQCSTDSRRRS